jgi:hypothetical protein
MKNIKLIGHLYFGILVIMAIIFYKERIIYCDAADYIFLIINKSTFHFEINRYGSAISQILPVIAVNAKMPLKVVLIFYSVSTVLVYYLIFLICTYLLKNPGAGILVILIISVGICHAYIHDIQETHTALAFTALLYAWLFYPWDEKLVLKQVLKYSGCFLLVLLCYFTHPSSAFPVLFILGYYVVSKNDWKNYKLYGIILLTLLLFVSKFLSIDANSYEGIQSSGLRNFSSVIPNFFHLYSLQYFLLRIRSVYFLTCVIFFVVTINYLYQREFLKLFYFLAATIAYFVLIIINFYFGDSDMMMEKDFQPLNVFIGIPFVADFLLKQDKVKIIRSVVYIFILFIGLSLFLKSALFYKKRTNYLAELIQSTKQLPGNKFIMDNKELPAETILISYAVSVETLLYSSLEGPQNSRTIFAENLKTFNQEALNTDQFLFTNFWPVYSINDLNKNYFNLEQVKYFRLNPDSVYLGSKYTSEEVYSCDADTLVNDGNSKNFVFKRYLTVLSGNGQSQSSDVAHSGKYSVLLTPENPFGLNIEIHNIQKGDRFKVAVWRYGSTKGCLVASDETGHNLYLNTDKSIKEDPANWELLNLNFAVNSKLPGDKIKIYVWNPGKEKVYFDDIKVIRYSKGF